MKHRTGPVIRALAAALIMLLCTPFSAPADGIARVESSLTAYVTGDDARAYAEPDPESESIPVAEGTEVEVLAWDRTWAMCTAKGYSVYIPVASLTAKKENETNKAADTAIPCKVKTKTVKVYKSNSTSSKVLGTLKKGTEVSVLAYNKTWARISVNGTVGYCKTSALTKSDVSPEPEPSPEPTPAPTPKPETLIRCSVTAKTAKLYSKASTGSKALKTLKKGTQVGVAAYNKTWAKVVYEGTTGYMKVSVLKKISLDPEKDPDDGLNEDERYRKKYPNAQFTATVVGMNVPAYSVSDRSKAISKLTCGTEVSVYAYTEDWAYIGIGDARGFVACRYISADRYTELKKGSSGSDVEHLETCLLSLGYFDGKPDEKWSDLTSDAVERFRRSVGLGSSDTADAPTQRILYAGYAPKDPITGITLTSGASGENVTRLQNRLYALGYLGLSSSITGKYASVTTKAVKMLQQRCSLTADGTVGAATAKVLWSELAVPKPNTITAADYVAPRNENGQKTVPPGLASTQSTLPSNATAEQRREYVIYIAQQQLTKPYVWGTAGPDTFDCSGLMCYCFKKIGISLNRSAYSLGYSSSSGEKITSQGDLQRGDILCFDTIADEDLSDHVGIYLGSGYFIHASSGETHRFVCVSRITNGSYHDKAFSWARRPKY